jgi:hypothetical protein
MELKSLKTVRFEVSKRKIMPWVPDVNMEWQVAVLEEGQKMMIELRTWLLTPVHRKYEDCITTPKTWWDHAKQAFLHKLPTGEWTGWPRRFLARHMTINYNHHKMPRDQHIHVCPHLEINKQGPHLEFLMMQGPDPMWDLDKEGF